MAPGKRGSAEQRPESKPQPATWQVALPESVKLSPVTGFMMGKIKVEGNMGMLMGLAGALGKLADSMARLDVQY